MNDGLDAAARWLLRDILGFTEDEMKEYGRDAEPILPCALTVGATVFCAGIKVSTAQGAINRLYDRMRMIEDSIARTDTPRTDKFMDQCSTCGRRLVPVQFAQDIERELATEQRNGEGRLDAADKRYTDLWDTAEKWHDRLSELIEAAQKVCDWSGYDADACLAVDVLRAAIKKAQP